MSMNFFSGDEANILSLDNIRATLIRLEDTIIFSIIERSQYALNPKMYQKGAFPELQKIGFEGTWLDWFLRETEYSHAKVRRFESPDEHPFTSGPLPEPILPPLNYPRILHPNRINVNPAIMAFYVQNILPTICNSSQKEDDGNYGSGATRDVEVLQAISRRIHCGMFVSESKFRTAPHLFVPHIKNPNPSALADLITKPAVEAALLVRLAAKARIYGQDIEGNGPVGAGKGTAMKMKIDVDAIVKLYKDWIIPLTKEVEVEYLLHRLDGLSEEEIEALSRPPATAAAAAN